ncbi:MAG: M20/M25/M40 family metallo-hydrolase [Terriglobia bacterium]
MTGNLVSIRFMMLLLLAAPLWAQTGPDFVRARDEAVRTLQELIRIDTSNPPGNETKAAEYLKAILDREGIASEILALEPARGNLVARLKGNGTKKPLLLMAHMDVVGVERDQWTVEPFAGLIQDGYVYGRGASDDKDDVAAMLQVLLLIHRQRTPLDRDVIFLAAAGEEGGSPVGVDYLVQHHWPKIEAEIALNEGGAIHMQDANVQYVGIQTAEKLPRGVRLVTRGVSGHGSVPRPDNPLARLGAAVAKVAEYQPPMRLNETTRAFFQRLARISPPEEAYLLTHLEDPAVQETLRSSTNRSHLTYNSMIRTSISPNIIRGGFRTNVIPAEAEAILDVRLLPGETREALVEELRRVINDPAVEVVPDLDWASMPPSPVSRLDSELFRALENAQARVFPDAVTLPTMSTGATDSSHLRAKGVQAFGVGSVGTDADRGRVHGNDERLWIEGYGKFLELVYRAVVEVTASRQ